MKNVLVTGGSRGIGIAAAELFARHGYRVFATYKKTEAPLRALSESLSKEEKTLVPLYADVTKEEDIKDVFEKTGDIDVLINNAGIAHFGLLGDTTSEEWDEVINTNLKSVFLCSKYASAAMIRKKRGAIINISSVWGIYGASCESAYSASKAGIIGFTRALAKELGPSGIRVNCIAPGVIETDMNAHLSAEDIKALCEETPLLRLGKPEDVARAALFFAENEFITGETLSVGGGFGL